MGGTQLRDSVESGPRMGPSDTNNHGHEEVRKAKAYKGICVALPHKGKPTKIFGNSPAEFISTLQGSSLGWVNFTTDDLEKDGTEVAVKLGFSDSLVSTLLKGYYASFEHLREIEEQADSMGELLLDPESPRLEIGRKIYQLKHALITYLNTLWRTADVLHSLRFGDAELIADNPKTLAKVGLLVEDVNRQISLSEHMSEVLASGLEVLQALYNNQLQTLNNRMTMTITWLTILGTAVLVPNTIATVAGSLGGMDSNMLFWYGAVLVLATVNSTYLAYWWVKRWVKLPTDR